MDTSNDPSTSLEHLEALLASGKLSREDYETLRAAMDARVERTASRPERPGDWRSLRKRWANRELGGVCAGLGEWTGIQPWPIRMGFILAFLFTGGGAVLVYIVLYAILPWKEEERDQVARFSLAFAAGVVGLWLVLQVVTAFMMGAVRELFAGASVKLPFHMQLALRLTELIHYNYVSLAAQALLLGAAIALHSMAPMRSPVRRVLAWAVCGGLALLIAFLFAAYASSMFTLMGPGPAEAVPAL